MPAKSKAQYRLMQAVKHNPKLAKKKGISAKMAEEFTQGSPKGLPEKKAAKGKKKR
jgi:hypothetical protein